MKQAARIVRWESTTDATLCGVEIAGLAPEARIEAELDRLLGRLTDLRPAFVLAGFGSGTPTEVAAAVSGASELFFNARVCVAVNEETLREIDPDTLADKNLGIVLDDVNASTPLSAMGAELVDAVRFDAGFVQRASEDVRSSCIMDAMLKLANDLGIATLGSSARRSGGFGFDYVPKQAPRK